MWLLFLLSLFTLCDEICYIRYPTICSMERKDENSSLVVLSDHTGHKMEAWLTTEIELRDIILTQEQFCIQVKFCVLWQDTEEKFRVKVDKKIIQKIKDKGMNSMNCTSL